MCAVASTVTVVANYNALLYELYYYNYGIYTIIIIIYLLKKLMLYNYGRVHTYLGICAIMYFSLNFLIKQSFH